MAVEEIELTIKVQIGLPEDLPKFYISQAWVDGNRDDRRFDLTCGAGVGNPFMDATARIPGVKSVHAHINMEEFTANLWDELNRRLDN